MLESFRCLRQTRMLGVSGLRMERCGWVQGPFLGVAYEQNAMPCLPVASPR